MVIMKIAENLENQFKILEKYNKIQKISENLKFRQKNKKTKKLRPGGEARVVTDL